VAVPESSGISLAWRFIFSIASRFICNFICEYFLKTFASPCRRSCVKPALEYHFTAIDLAANSGHHLGTDYSPRKLRAIRRFSIHRAFKILDMRYRSSEPIRTILARLNETTEL
jgi:hypothetical protein